MLVVQVIFGHILIVYISVSGLSMFFFCLTVMFDSPE